jgi:hypothetical protein
MVLIVFVSRVKMRLTFGPVHQQSSKNFKVFNDVISPTYMKELLNTKTFDIESHHSEGSAWRNTSKCAT